MRKAAQILSFVLVFVTSGDASAASPAGAKVKTTDTEKAAKQLTGGALDPASREYRIGPQDVLQIVVWQNADLSRTVPVRPDGLISLPLLNDIPAAGFTTMQLRENLRQRLEKYMPSAEVSVLVMEVNSFQVTVIGAVQRPERYTLKRPTTVLEALALAGGFKDFADTERVVVLRAEAVWVDGRLWDRSFKRIPFNYKKIISVGGQTENFALESGDIVIVP
jgi:polysaccharide biosynthesis/export protein